MSLFATCPAWYCVAHGVAAPRSTRPLRRTVLSLGLCLGIGALPAVAAAGATFLGDALKVNVILTRAEDFAAFTAWSGPRWRSGAAAVYPNRRLFPEHPQARDELLVGRCTNGGLPGPVFVPLFRGSSSVLSKRVVVIAESCRTE